MLNFIRIEKCHRIGCHNILSVIPYRLHVLLYGNIETNSPIEMNHIEREYQLCSENCLNILINNVRADEHVEVIRVYKLGDLWYNIVVQLIKDSEA